MTNAIFYISMMLFLSAVGAVVYLRSTFYRQAVADENTSTFIALDGLRGVLALSVFVHHSRFFVEYFQTSIWQMPKQSFLFMVGSVSVSIFFMITGFLFWSKVIRTEGRIAILTLYRSRFLRIYPMFLFSFAIVLLITAFRSHGTFNENPATVLVEILRWLLVGLVGFPVLNDVQPWFLSNAGVYWTLQWETWFYLTLPLTGFLFWRKSRFFAAVGIFFLLIPVTQDYLNIINIGCFVLGAIAAYILRQWRELPISQSSMSLICVALVLALTGAAQYLPAFTWRLIAFPIFLLVLYGCDLFGMLTSKAWRALGLMSYSIYLIHGSVLYLGLGLLDHFLPLRSISTAVIFFALLGCAAAVVAISASTYQYIERPFIKYHAKRSAPALRAAPEQT